MIKTIVKALTKALAGFLLGMVFYFSILLIYWQFAPYKTADVVTPMYVLNENKEVSADRVLKLQFEFTKHTNVNPDVSRNILCVDDTVHFVTQNPNGGVTRPIGTFTAKPVFTLDDSVPTNTQCFFQFTNIYQVNPIRTITKVWLSEPFTVVE